MPAIEYFREILETLARSDELRTGSRPVVGTLCNFVPEALVIAAGAVPVRVCAGDHAAALQGEAVVPRDICPVCKSTVGTLRSPGGPHGRLDLLVVPAVCDAKKKLPQVLEGQCPVHVMELPVDKQGPGAERRWLEQVRFLAERLEKLTGQRITRQGLRGAIDFINQRQSAYRELLALRQEDPPRLSGLEALLLTNASFSDDVARWTQHARVLAAERRSAPAPARGPRLVVTGAPLIHPNLRLVELVESLGAHVVADDMCSGGERLYVPIIPQEWNLPEMLLAVAETALLPTTCPCFSRHDDRLARIGELVDAYSAQGVVYHNLRLCTLYQFEATAVRDSLAARSVPMLELQTDYTPEDTEQMHTRVQAFLEMLAARVPVGG